MAARTWKSRQFKPNVDLRRKQSIIDYLANHDTHGDGFAGSSLHFANNMKVTRLNWPSYKIEQRILDLISTDDFYHHLEEVINHWQEAHNFLWAAAWAGRSGGWLELNASILTGNGMLMLSDTEYATPQFAEHYADWSMDDLRGLAVAVRDFDLLCNDLITAAADFASEFTTEQSNDRSIEGAIVLKHEPLQKAK